MVSILRKSEGGSSSSTMRGYEGDHLGFGGLGGGKGKNQKGGKGKNQEGGIGFFAATVFVTFLTTLCKIPQVIATSQEANENVQQCYDRISGVLIDDCEDVAKAGGVDVSQWDLASDALNTFGSWVGVLPPPGGWPADTIIPAYISGDDTPFPPAGWTSKNYLEMPDGKQFTLSTLDMENLASHGVTDTAVIGDMMMESAVDMRTAGRMFASYMARRESGTANTYKTETIYNPNDGKWNVDALERARMTHESQIKQYCTHGQYSTPESFAQLLVNSDIASDGRLAAMGSKIQQESHDLSIRIGTKSTQVTPDMLGFAMQRYADCQTMWTMHDTITATENMLKLHSNIGRLNVADITPDEVQTIFNQFLTGGGVSALREFKGVLGSVFNPESEKGKEIMDKIKNNLNTKMKDTQKSVKESFMEAAGETEEALITVAAKFIIIPFTAAVKGFGYSGPVRVFLSAASFGQIPTSGLPKGGDVWNLITVSDVIANFFLVITGTTAIVGLVGKVVTKPLSEMSQQRIEDKQAELDLDTQRALLDRGFIRDPRQGIISATLTGPRYLQIENMANQITQGSSVSLPSDIHISSSQATLIDNGGPPPLVVGLPDSVSIPNPLPLHSVPSEIPIADGEKKPSVYGRFKSLFSSKTNPSSKTKSLQLTNGQPGGKKRSVKKHKNRRKHTKKLNKKNRSKKNRRKKHNTVKRRNKKTARRRR